MNLSQARQSAIKRGLAAGTAFQPQKHFCVLARLAQWHRMLLAGAGHGQR